MSCLERAKQELTNGDILHDRYACLELRQCIEALAYEKIRAYRNRIPVESYLKWQPATLIKILTKLEPDSAFDKRISIFEEDENGKPVNEVLSFNQKEITGKFINERYHKLSSYLHTPTNTKTQNKLDGLHDYLLKTSIELEEFVNSTSYTTIAEVVNFTCTACEKPVARNLSSLEDGAQVECFNPHCKARYTTIDKGNGEYSFNINHVNLDCSCGNSLCIWAHDLRENTHTICKKCSTKYTIDRPWAFRLADRNEDD